METALKIDLYVDVSSVANYQEGKFILAGDLGKTNTRFRISHVSQIKGIRHILSGIGPSANSADNILNNIRNILNIAQIKCRISRIDRAVIGLPGKVSKDRQSCAISYLDSSIYLNLGSEINKLGVGEVLLLNDLECGTLGVKASLPEQFRRVRESKTDVSLPPECFVLGMPGSGLGIGLSLGRNTIIPSEGGNILAMVAPREEEERAVWERFNQRFVNADRGQDGWLTYNDIACGPGILLIAQYLLEESKYQDSTKTVASQILSASEDNVPIIISKLALKGNLLCKQVFKIFARFLARALQSVSLVTLPEMAILGGQIVVENKDLIITEFITHFSKHIIHNTYLKSLPIYLIENKDVNLDGATYGAAKSDLKDILSIE